ncbi:MAG: ricin-type beta-trefoil lectin domain protein [Proteobacteria bacterium]|nr:ricin-type beta-trefoil lectin domain protein [Pseudomonadota bacterium]
MWQTKVFLLGILLLSSGCQLRGKNSPPALNRQTPPTSTNEAGKDPGKPLQVPPVAQAQDTKPEPLAPSSDKQESGKQVPSVEPDPAPVPVASPAPVPTPVPSPKALYYNLRSADPVQHKGECIDVSGARTDDNIAIIVYPCLVDALNQQLMGLSPDQTSFQIKARHSLKCAENASVAQKACVGAKLENWEYDPGDQADFRLRHVVSGKCMKILANSTVVLGDCKTNSSLLNRVPLAI